MIYSPIWKDLHFATSDAVLDYLITNSDGEVLHTGYAKRMPDNTGVTINVNNIVEEYVTPDFDVDIRPVDDDVVTNSSGYQEFALRSGSTVLETYGFLYDWSYEDRWSGQTEYLMTQAINGHCDSRMKSVVTLFNTGETSFNWELEYDAIVELNPTSLIFAHTGGTKNVTIRANVDWEIVSLPSWLTASTTSGTGTYDAFGTTVIEFSADANSGGTERSGYVVIRHSDGDIRINVLQLAYVGLSVIPTSLTYTYTADTKYLNVVTNGRWWVESVPPWVQLSQTSGNGSAMVSVTVPTNTAYTPRYGVLTFSTADEMESVLVEQDAWTDSVSITPSSYTYPTSGGSAVFTITSNVNWNITNIPDWLAIQGPLSGTPGTTNITGVTMSANNTFTAKTGSINVTAGNASAAASVTQARLPMTLSVSPLQMGFMFTGGTKQATVTSNYGWSVSSNTSSWVTVSPSSGGSGTTTVTIDADANFSGAYRYGQVVFYNEDNVVTLSLGEEDGSGGDYWIVCTYNFPEAGRQQVAGANMDYGTSELDTVMIVDGYQTTASTYYNFDTAGVHIVKFRVQGASGWIGMSDFTGVPYMVSVDIPENVEGIANAAFSACTALTSAVIAEGAFRELGEAAFAGCSSLQSFTLPSTTRFMYGDAFENCTGLTSVTLNEGLVGMREHNFFGCESLTQVTLPNSLVEWSGGNFAGCTSLTAVTLGTGVTDIPDTTFQNCTALTAITIPANITEIKTYAFRFSGVISITAESQTAATVDSGAFTGIPTGGTLYYPEGADYTSWFTAGLGERYWNLPVPYKSIKYTSVSGNVVPFSYYADKIIANTYTSEGGEVLYDPTVVSDEYAVPGYSDLETLAISDVFNGIDPQHPGLPGTAYLRVTNNQDLRSLRLGVDFGETPFYYKPSKMEVVARSITGNTALESVIFECYVTSVGGYAFSGCTNLSSISFYNSQAPTAYSTTFNGIAQTGVLHYPQGATDNYATLISYLPQGWTAVADL